MPVANVSLAVEADAVRRGMAALRDQLEVVVDHPADVVAEAEDAARAARWRGDGRPDRTSVPLLTIDPPGSRDLDQAYFAERRGSGTRVWYAIADVASFVNPGGALDAECHRRGVTLYGPDGRVSLHPPLLAEGAASLLPDEDRPALLWCIDLDETAAPQATRLERAIVRSRAQLSYDDVQEHLTRGDAPEPLTLLREIGELRLAAERARGGVSLPIPEQVVEHDDHHYRLAYRAPLQSESWNAQISLLTGMEAARIMIEGGSGLLRTLDEPDRRTVSRLRHMAKALGVRWPKDGGYAEFVRSLDPALPAGAALLVQSTRLLRGAGYEAFRPGAPPERPVHAAVAAPYAHVTAPLRRLCDRATNEVVLAHVEGRAVPEWAAASLEELPRSMADARRREGQYSRASLDLVEALVLAPLVGSDFAAVVVDVDEGRALLQLREPAAVGWAAADSVVSPGDEVQARLLAADPVERRIELSITTATST